MVNIIFWIFLLIIVYTYLGYTVLLIILSAVKKIFSASEKIISSVDLPEVTLLIAAYNEKNILKEKIQNCRETDYPAGKLKIVFVTDGSGDGSAEFLKDFPDITVYHENERKGKTAAINRVMPYIQTPFVIFTDANSIINQDAIRNIMLLFNDKSVGCVAGEKRVMRKTNDQAVSSGESLYWKYESLIKKYESELYSSISAAGELYAIRTSLFKPVPDDSILDDFVISIQIALQGFKTKYTSGAYSTEHGSATMHDEMKRKTRIASGSFQTLFRYPSLLNVFRYGFLSFQYWSHKVLRWLVVPFAFIIVFALNGWMAIQEPVGLYSVLFILQLFFYFFVFIGFVIRKRELSVKFIFLPYYLFSMNAGLVIGLIKYSTGKHNAAWDKAERIK